MYADRLRAAFFFQEEDGIRYTSVTGVQTCALPISITTKTPDNLSVNLPAAPVGNAAAAGSIALLITNRLTGALALELSALEADGKGKIISSPRVMTANNVEALIEQGTELPYQQATSSGATSVAFRKANLALRVKPQVTPDGNIIMTLD